MIDLVWPFFKIVIVDFILFTMFNKYLVKCLISDSLKNWTIAYTITAFALPIICRVFGESHNFAFFLSISFIILLFGFSANFKEELDIHQLIESTQKRTMKFAIIASVIGYLSFASFVAK